MFCKHCGNMLPDDAVFCAKCGTPVSDAARQAVNTDRPSTASPPAPKPYNPSLSNTQTRVRPTQPPQPPQPMAPPQPPAQQMPYNPGAATGAKRYSPLHFVEGILAIALVVALAFIPFLELGSPYASSMMGPDAASEINKSYSIFEIIKSGFESWDSLAEAKQNTATMTSFPGGADMQQYVEQLTMALTILFIAMCVVFAIALICSLVVAVKTMIKATPKRVGASWGLLICTIVYIGTIYGIYFYAVNAINSYASSYMQSMGGSSMMGSVTFDAASLFTMGPTIWAWAILAGCVALVAVDMVRGKR